MSDELTPNYLTYQKGVIGANFTGHVHAGGLDLDAATTSTPPSEDQVRWIRQSDGAVVAQLLSYTSSADNLVLLANRVDPNTDTFLTLGAMGDPLQFNKAAVLELFVDDDGASAVNASADKGAHGANSGSVLIIDANQRSSFLQLPVAINQRIDHGTATGIVPGGWTSIPIAFNINFGASNPDFVYSVNGAGASIVGTEFNGLSGAGVTVDVNSTIAQTVHITWYAIG